MRRSRFSDTEIVAILGEADTRTVDDVCQNHGISRKTFYRWRAKFAEALACESRRVRELEDENARLKRLVVEQALNLAALRDVCAGRQPQGA